MSLITLLKNSQPLSFAEYMRLALYAPGLGYYSAGLEKIGKQGDFITAPELGSGYAYALANQCSQVLASLGEGSILEFGAGTGQLCVDLLTRLETLDALPAHYDILELSASLKARQQNLIQSALPHLSARVQWLEKLPETAFKGIVLANEVLDAMPVHRFMKNAEGLFESYIEIDETNQLKEVFYPATNQRLIDYVARCLPVFDFPYISEVNLFVEGWLQACFELLTEGVALIIDYGFPRPEYYHPDRRNGTLICHYQHQIEHNFLARPGEQDITAHVDFTQVAEAAAKAGFEVAGFSNQAAFLLSNDILDFANQASDERERLRRNQALKQLLQPQEMGELLKVIALCKNIDLDLQGFQLQDKRASL